MGQSLGAARELPWSGEKATPAPRLPLLATSEKRSPGRVQPQTHAGTCGGGVARGQCWSGRPGYWGLVTGRDLALDTRARALSVSFSLCPWLGAELV